MKEKDFQSEWTRSIRRHLIDNCWTKDFLYHKISDMSMDRKPFDCFLMYKDKFVAMELKLHKSESAFAFSKLELHQKNALLRSDKAWGISAVIINIRTSRSVNYVAIFDISTWITLEDTIWRKSIPFKDIKDHADIIIERKWWLWNLTWFLWT